MRNFADVLMEAVDAKQSRLVVGLDPRINLIPDDLCEPAMRAAGSFCGAAAEIITAVTEDTVTFRRLKNRPQRVCGLDVPIPFSPPLEEYALPDGERITAAVKQVMQ